MTQYKNAHLWLIVVFIVVFLGFLRGYFLNFADESFDHHIHMFTALVWFGVLMTQPWLATRGRMSSHRRNGMIGLFAAGLVVGTALLMVPANIEGAIDRPEGGFVGPTFLYGITFFDLCLVSAFSICLVMGILKSKQMNDHAIWMLSTVYCLLAPAFSRMMIFPIGMIFGFEELTFIKVIFISQPIILLAIVITALRLKKFHPALVLVFVVNACAYLVQWMGNNAWWRSFCDSLFL